MTNSRLQRVQARLARENVDLLALGPGSHMGWVLGFYPHPDERPCMLCVTPDDAAMLMPALNAADVRAQTDLTFFEWADEDGPRAAFEAMLDHLNAGSARHIALDEAMRADFAHLVSSALVQAQVQFTPATLGHLRMIKEPNELALIRENALINDRAFQAGAAAAHAGMREQELADIIRAHYPGEGAKPAFSIIASGPNAAYPHHSTGDRALCEGEVNVIDIGGTKGGAFSDMTRMLCIGAPPSRYAELHEIVNGAVEAALEVARPGAVARDIDAAARGVIERAGYGAYFTHRLGHGLGLEIHEPPWISASSETVIEAGMVFSIEPGIYIPGEIGLRLEDIVIIGDDGPEIVSGLPRDLVIAGG